MARIQGKPNVRKAIIALSREVTHSVKTVNQKAAKSLGKGDYASAQSQIELAKSIAQFGDDVNSLRSRWTEIRRAGKGAKTKGSEATPLWEYYQLILRALVELGGDASRKEIESRVESIVHEVLSEGDFETNSRGIPKWKVMISRAKRHMIREGFLSNVNFLRWTITKKGEQAAKAQKK